MAIVFSSARGSVRRVPTYRAAIPFRVNIWGTTFQKSIITQAAISHNDNYQFLHTLADTVYVYVFGSRVGELVVGGMAFAQGCFGGDGPSEVMQWYQSNRISQRPSMIQVVFGQIVFNALLTGLNVQLTDAENIISQWTYRFSVFPGN